MHKLILTTVLGLVFAAPYKATKQHQTVNFPSGKVTAMASLPNGGFPAFSFKRGSETLLNFTLGRDRPELFRMLPGQNDEPGREDPVVRFRLLPGPDGTQLIEAVAAMHGGSDCGYEAQFVGERNGKLTTLLDKPAEADAEGGVYVGDIPTEHLYGMVTWDYIWSKGEYHLGPHRYRVKLYRLDTVTGKFVLVWNRVTKQKYDDGDPLAEFGLHVKNQLRWLPELDC